MKIRALDQVHISSVQADSLRPGQEFDVADELGEKMLKSLPGHLARVDEPAPAPAEVPARKEKQPHPNKAKPAAPANKAKPKAKAKAAKA